MPQKINDIKQTVEATSFLFSSLPILFTFHSEAVASVYVHKLSELGDSSLLKARNRLLKFWCYYRDMCTYSTVLVTLRTLLPYQARPVAWLFFIALQLLTSLKWPLMLFPGASEYVLFAAYFWYLCMSIFLFRHLQLLKYSFLWLSEVCSLPTQCRTI